MLNLDLTRQIYRLIDIFVLCNGQIVLTCFIPSDKKVSSSKIDLFQGNIEGFLMIECILLIILFAITLAFSIYLYYFLGKATPTEVLSKRMFFNSRLRFNIRVVVYLPLKSVNIMISGFRVTFLLGSTSLRQKYFAYSETQRNIASIWQSLYDSIPDSNLCWQYYCTLHHSTNLYLWFLLLWDQRCFQWELPSQS